MITSVVLGILGKANVRLRRIEFTTGRLSRCLVGQNQGANYGWKFAFEVLVDD